MKKQTLVVMAAIAAMTLTLMPSKAHTGIVLAAGQIVPGGYVNGQRVADGPAVDGTILFTNADVVSYTINGSCITAGTCGSDSFSVTVPSLAVSQEFCKSGLRRGTYLLTASGVPTMKGEVRITVNSVACAH